MMMMSTIDAIVLYEALNKISTNKDIQIPIKLGFKMLRNLRELESTYLSFQEARDNVVKRVGTQDSENPDKYEIPKDKLDELNAEITQLSLVCVDIDVVPITLDELESLNLTVPELAALYPIIEDTGEA